MLRKYSKPVTELVEVPVFLFPQLPNNLYFRLQMSRIKPAHIFWLSLAVGLIVRLIIIFQPEANLLTRWGSDDLYYYSQIAGHVASGDGFTFDGIHATNGFQPLFLFALLPFGKMMLNDWHSAWVVVSLVVTILSVLACFQLRSLSREMGWSEWLAVILPGVFILHSKILSVTFNGTEGALSFLMFILTLRAFIWMRDSKRFWLSILVFSLFVITRMEFSLVLFLLAVFALSQGQSLKRWLLVAVGPIVTFSSWLLINYVSFGDMMPSSGQAKALHANWYDFPFLDGFKGAVGTVFYAESAISWVVIGLMLVGLYGVFQKKDKYLWQLLIFLGVVSVILASITIVKLHGFRDWYLIPQFVLMLIVVAHGIEWFIKGNKKYLFLFPVIIAGIWGEAQFAPRKFEGQEVIAVCKEVRDFIPEKVAIGVYNAGLPGACLGDRYFVINLDGVVNNSVLAYLESGRMDKYAELQKIHLLLDNKQSLYFFRNRGMKTTPLHDFGSDSQSWRMEIVWSDFSLIEEDHK